MRRKAVFLAVQMRLFAKAGEKSAAVFVDENQAEEKHLSDKRTSA